MTRHAHVHFGDDGSPFDGVIVERDIEIPLRGRSVSIRYIVEVREKNGNWRRLVVPFPVHLSARAGGRLIRDSAGGVCYVATAPTAGRATMSR